MIKLKVYKIKDGIKKPSNVNDLELITETVIEDNTLAQRPKEHRINLIATQNKFAVNDIIGIDIDDNIDFYIFTKIGTQEIDIKLYKEQGNIDIDTILKNIEQNEKTDVIQNESENRELLKVAETNNQLTSDETKQEVAKQEKKVTNKKQNIVQEEKQYVRLWDKIAEIQQKMEQA